MHPIHFHVNFAVSIFFSIIVSELIFKRKTGRQLTIFFVCTILEFENVVFFMVLWTMSFSMTNSSDHGRA